VSGSGSGHHSRGGITGVRLAGPSHPRAGSSLLLGPLLRARGTRGACNGMNVHHCGENSNIKNKSPLPVTPNIKVVYDTSPRTTTRVDRGGSLIGGTKALDAQVG
jgi:hypothetical protein